MGNITNPNTVGRQRVEVIDRDVDDVRLTVIPSWMYRGKVTLEDGTPSGLSQAYVFTFLDGAGEKGQIIRLEPDGTFEAKGLEAGAYRASVPFAPEFIVKHVSVNGREFQGGKIAIPAAGEGTLDIVVSKTGASVGGTVEFLGKEDPEIGTVTLIAEPLTPLDGGAVNTQTPEQTGSFRFPLLEVGTYRVCAWNDRGTAVNNILNDPRFEPKLKSGCKTVTLDEEDGKQVQLKQLDVATFQ